MEFKQTKRQIVRGTRPDAEPLDNKLYLIKRTSELHATYQIRLLTYRAIQEGKKLIIEIPRGCKIHDDLQALTKQYPRIVKIVRT